MEARMAQTTITKRAELARRLFLEAALDDRILAFSGGMEAEAGVPDLGTLGEFATACEAEVSHLGFGCFVARGTSKVDYSRHDCFSFDAGGAMDKHEIDGEFLGSTSVRFDDVAYKIAFDAMMRGRSEFFREVELAVARKAADSVKKAREEEERVVAKMAAEAATKLAADEATLAQEHARGWAFDGLQATCLCGWKSSFLSRRILATNAGKRHIKDAEAAKRQLAMRFGTVKP